MFRLAFKTVLVTVVAVCTLLAIYGVYLAFATSISIEAEYRCIKLAMWSEAVDTVPRTETELRTEQLRYRNNLERFYDDKGSQLAHYPECDKHVNNLIFEN